MCSSNIVVCKYMSYHFEFAQELKKRLEEVASNEEKLTEINSELNQQIAQMVKDFDADKREALERYSSVNIFNESAKKFQLRLVFAICRLWFAYKFYSQQWYIAVIWYLVLLFSTTRTCVFYRYCIGVALFSQMSELINLSLENDAIVNDIVTLTLLYQNSILWTWLALSWLVVLRIYVASAVFQPYLDLETGDNQSLKFKWRGRESNPGTLAPQAKSLTTRPPLLPVGTKKIVVCKICFFIWK